jgi:hypothetical protein
MAFGPRELAITLKTIAGSAFSGPLDQAKAEIKAFGSDVSATFEQVEERSEKLKDVWKDLFEAFIGVEVLDQLKRIAEAADDASGALEIAGRVTKNFGHDFNAEEMDSWLRRLASSAEGGGYALRDMRSSMQELATTGATQAQQQRLLVDALGLAAAKHIGVAEATHIAVEAATGHVEMLSRYGIAVKDAEGKTVDFSTAMERWESMVAGAAEERAKGLEGAFGRVGNALDRLVNTAFGQQLITDFEGVANAIAHVLDAVGKLPSWFLALAAASTFSMLSLTALGLMLPGLKIAFEFLGNGIGLVWSLLGIGGKVVGFAVAGFRDLVTWVSLARDAFTGAALAEWATEAPLLAIVAAVAVVIAIVVELIAHLNDLGEAFKNTLSFASTAWKEFADGFGENAKSIGYGIKSAIEFSSGNWVAGAMDLKKGQDLSRGMPETGKAVFNAFKGGADRAMDYIKGAWKSVTDFFTEKLGDLGKQTASWAGLGGPGKIKASDLAAWFAPIDAMLAEAKHRVEVAQNALEESTTKLAVLRDQRDPFKPLTVDGPTGIAAEQALEHEQLERTLALRKEIANQRDVELRAAQAEQALMGRVTGNAEQQSKAHAEIAKRMNEHLSGASKLNVEFIKLLGTIAKLERGIQHAFDPLTLQQLDLSKTASLTAEQLAEHGTAARKELDKRQFDLKTAVRPASPVESEQEAQRQAEFDRTIAQLQKQLAQQDYFDAVARAKTMAPVAGQALIQQATQNLYMAAQRLTNANDAVAASAARVREALENTGFNLTKFAEGLIAKLNVPGLTVRERTTPSGQSAGIEFGKFNWTTMLLDAAQKSKAFADIMKVVNEIMQVFAEIIDALRPVIDLVLKAIGFLANIFIDLYNVVARILRAFGVHVALLDRINTDFTNLDQVTAPLISVIHDIPTLNELASGRIGTLSPTATSYSSLEQIQQPTIDALNSPDLGGGLLGMLGSILEGVLALKLVMSITGGGGIVGAIKSVFGGGSSIFSGISKLFGGGASSSAAPSGADAVEMGGGGESLDTAASSTGGGGGVAGWLASSGVGAALEGLGIGDLGVTLGQKVGGGIPGGIIGGLGATAGLSVALGGGLSLSGIGAALSATGVGLPVGLLVAGLGAALGGGLFGDHNSKQNEPDKYLPGYQDFLSQYNNGASNDEGFQLEAMLKNVNPKNLTGQALADYQKLIGLGGSNGDIGIAHEKDDQFTFGSGTTDQVEDFIALVNRSFTELGQSVTSSVGGAMQSLAQQAQSITQGVNAGLNELGSQATSIASAGSGALGGLIAGATAPNGPTTGGDVHLHLGPITTGPVNNMGDADSFVDMIVTKTTMALANRQYVLGA